MGKDLRIDQSYEDLEDQFEPDEKFFFDAIIQLKESNWTTKLTYILKTNFLLTYIHSNSMQFC